MTALETSPGGFDEGGAARRLWPALSHRVFRYQPPKGADALGERITARLRRARAGPRLRARAGAIADQSAQFRDHSTAAFRDRIESVRELVLVGRDDPATIDAAYAVAMESIRRELSITLHDEQIMGALGMARGACVEMATGEGKTVTAVLPAVLDAWLGRGMHVITVNDYLAARDASGLEPVYRMLGLSVGVVQTDSSQGERREAYARDVTYSSDKQVIFDHLRDRLAAPLRPRLVGHLLADLHRAPGEALWSDKVVQRGLHAAIVDEADSVLIDEATTPAIISLPVSEQERRQQTEHYALAERLSRQFSPGTDYTLDRKIRRVELTERGRDRLAKLAGELPAYWAGPRRSEELIVQAIQARELFLKGEDYIIRDDEIIIVDRSTGRLLEGRKWQLGVHQAVEAKEGVEITPETHTTARSSYQRFFQQYQRLSGMSGTVWEVAEELWQFYRLRVLSVPTHRTVIRTRARTRSYPSESDKFAAVADRIEGYRAAGRPVLVGTRSVNASERLAEVLGGRGIPCRVLNATREKQEAEIVAGAGRGGPNPAITVATNMAGRGTDIIIDVPTRERGGLVVIATERHDTTRVDRQLQGRTGRQGDPGLVETHVALDDDLIRRFGPSLLVALVRVAPRPIRRLAVALLWGSAQLGASRAAASIRMEVARADAWLEMAMHHHTR